MTGRRSWWREHLSSSGKPVEREIDEELRYHLDRRTDEFIRSGMPPREAKAEAERVFGNIEYTRRYCHREAVRGARRVDRRDRMTRTIGDVRFALRQLRRDPVFAFFSILVLALGVGANSAIFSVVSTVLWTSLPYGSPAALVRVRAVREGTPANVSPLDYLDWRASLTSLSGVTAFTTTDEVVTVGDRAERLPGAIVSSEFLDVLEVRPHLGRGLIVGDDDPQGPRVVVISTGIWLSMFGGDSAVVGSPIMLGGEQHQVVGVLPVDFVYPDPASLERPAFLIPLRIDPARNGRGGHWLQVVGRMAPGSSISQVRAELAAMSRALAEQYPRTNAGWGTEVQALHDAAVGPQRRSLLMVLGAVALVLLVCCITVANLVFARAVTRRREVAIRTALGASRGRLIAQSLMETVTLSAIGGTVALAVAWWLLDLITRFGPAGIPRLTDVHLDTRIVMLTAMVAIGTGLLFGLVPALRTTRLDPMRSLRQSSATTSESAGRVRRILVVAEIALSLVLLAGTGWLLRSLWRLEGVNPGFDASGVLLLRLSVPENHYATAQSIGAFFRELEERLREQPFVTAAGVIQSHPLGGDYSCNGFALDDRPDFDRSDAPCVEERVASNGYFHAMGIPLLRGRLFDDDDDLNRERVVVINQAFARTHWPDGDPLGVRFTWGSRGEHAQWRTIVGVVGDVHHFGLAKPPQPEVYLPEAQFPVYRDMTLVVRSADQQPQLVAALRHEVAQLDPDLVLYDIIPMRDLVASSLANERFRAWMVGGFAALALTLAFAGIYGVMLQAVSVREREFGIRLALGADRRSLRALVVGEGLRLAIVGIGLGVAGAIPASRAVGGLLFGVTPSDPVTAGIVLAVVVSAAWMGSYLPTRRITRFDPALTMRDE